MDADLDQNELFRPLLPVRCGNGRNEVDTERKFWSRVRRRYTRVQKFLPHVLGAGREKMKGNVIILLEVFANRSHDTLKANGGRLLVTF